MQEKRYSVFISSTFEDLRNERQAVQDAVLSAGDFPVQMESFPAADEDQFEFIKALIDKCDYYILIVAGRYGKPAADGVSYTEKEYYYAKSQSIPILVLLHGDPDSIPVSKAETTDIGKKRLAAFIQEVSTGRLRNTWTTTGDLKHAVRDALDNAKLTRPSVGWVRGDTTASAELLSEMNEVRKENERLRSAIGSLEVELALPPIPAAEDPVRISLFGRVRSEADGMTYVGSYAMIECSWISIFPFFYNGLKWKSNDWDGEYFYSIDINASCCAIGDEISLAMSDFDATGMFILSNSDFSRLKNYYIEVGLMNEEGEGPFTESGNRAARRYSIAYSGKAEFIIIKGGIIVTESPSENIPF